LNDEKRNIWLRRSSCSGALVDICAVLTMLWTVTGGRASLSAADILSEGTAA
jgi:hypothetical protein